MRLPALLMARNIRQVLRWVSLELVSRLVFRTFSTVKLVGTAKLPKL